MARGLFKPGHDGNDGVLLRVNHAIHSLRGKGKTGTAKTVLDTVGPKSHANVTMKITNSAEDLLTGLGTLTNICQCNFQKALSAFFDLRFFDGRPD